VIAQQFESAGQSEKAIAYWRQAGERDLRRFAMKEAVTQYSNALRLVLAMPETPDRDALELDIRLGLGFVQQISHGPTQEDAAIHYHRALALSQALPGRGRERFLASWGLWFNAVMRGAGPEAAERSGQLVGIAQEFGDPSLLMEAYHAKVPMLLKTPDFAGVSEAAQEVIRLYDRERHRDHSYYFGGHDARMCARSFYALGLWGQGLVDQAWNMSWLGVDDARQLGHVFSLAHALQRTGMLMMLLKDAAGCRAAADELYPLAERNKFPWQLSDALFLRGWLAAHEGHYKSGIEPMVHSANLPFFAAFRSFYFVQIAEAELRAGELDRATTALDRTIKEVDTDHFCEPEIHRLRGDILLAQSRGNAAAAEQAFRAAMALAVRQSCRVLELRAAASLARLLGDEHRRAEAHNLLAPVYAAFTEGFDKPDLQAARALLAQLN
jgi:predicted ATPase